MNAAVCMYACLYALGCFISFTVFLFFRSQNSRFEYVELL